MRIGNVDLDKQVLVVAEVGNNHEGSYDHAARMIEAAAHAGVDAVKFQTYRTELFIAPQHTERFAKLKAFELTYREFEGLSTVASDYGVQFLSTPLDCESAEFLKNLVSAFKIASGDNMFYPLIDQIASFGKPMVISTGLLAFDQICSLQARIDAIWREIEVDPGMLIMHCVAAYPAPPQDINLSVIPAMRETLGCSIGYSDHALGIQAAIGAVFAGAQALEKHFTLDKNFSSFRDHQLAADPKEMEELVQRVKQARELLGRRNKTLVESEKPLVGAVRRRISAACDLKAGAVIGDDDLVWLRNQDGLLAGDEDRVLGRVLCRPLVMGETFSIDGVEFVTGGDK